MDKYAVLALCFLLVFQGVTELIVISRATDYSVWRYHKVLTVTNSTALPVGYQLNFTLWKGVGVDSAGNFYLNNHANDNLYDLRFVDGNGILLDMWNQSAIAGETHVHTWIELASSLIVVMYYGNEYASSEWDTASAVFERVIDGVVLALPFEESSGTACEDFSGNDYDGVSYGATVTTGRWTYGRMFVKAESDVVRMAKNYTVGTNSFSFFCWVNATSHGTEAGGANRITTLGYNYTTNAPVLAIHDDHDAALWKAGVDGCYAGNGPYGSFGEWLLFGVTFNSSLTTNNVHFFKNTTDSGAKTFNYDFEGASDAIGSSGGVANRWMDGILNNCVMTNTVLSSDDFAALHDYYPDVTLQAGSVLLREWQTGVSTSSGAETDTQSTEVTTEQDVNWMAFIVLLVFAILNVVLILIPRVYILNFVVAALTLAFSAATVNDSTLPIQPYFSLIVALLSVLGILRAANLLRNQ